MSSNCWGKAWQLNIQPLLFWSLVTSCYVLMLQTASETGDMLTTVFYVVAHAHSIRLVVWLKNQNIFFFFFLLFFVC